MNRRARFLANGRHRVEKPDRVDSGHRLNLLLLCSSPALLQDFDNLTAFHLPRRRARQFVI
jgi:hypothetical protein